MQFVGLAFAFMIAMATLGLFVSAGAALIALLAIGALGYGIFYLVKQSNDKDKQRALDENRRLKEREEIRLLTAQAAKEFPAPAEFILDFAKALNAYLPDAPEEFHDVRHALLRAMLDIYKRELPLPPRDQSVAELRRAAADAQKFDHIILAEVMLKAARGFLTALPTYRSPQFKLPIAELVDLPSTIYGLIAPFRDERLFQRRQCLDIWETFHGNAVAAGRGKAPVYPQELKSGWPRSRVADLYLRGTPFHQLLHLDIPFGFDDETRSTHHWCLGHTGTGKTTYLRHFIKVDLERVQKGECSLVVLDSKKLIREMRTLRAFAHELKDRVLIVDPEHPIALNPFYLPIKKDVRDVMRYMLANLSEASDLQKGALTFLVDAAATYPRPSLYTIRDFFALKRDEVPAELLQFDADTQFWFRNTFKNLHPATKEGLHQRLTNFLKENEVLCAMLNADRCLNVFDWLHEGGRVLLIDTDRDALTPEGTNVLGRLFIALLDQVSSRRTKFDEHKLKPIFCVIDEAGDYIKDDTRFADMLIKAREQKVAVTVAHQVVADISHVNQAYLENAGMKTICERRKSVTVHTRERDYTIPIQPLDFTKDEPQMDPEEYKRMRKDIDENFGIRPAASAAAEEPAQQEFDRP